MFYTQDQLFNLSYLCLDSIAKLTLACLGFATSHNFVGCFCSRLFEFLQGKSVQSEIRLRLYHCCESCPYDVDVLPPTSVKSQVLYMRRPSWPTHSRMYVTRSACSLSRNGPLKISSQYCFNDLNSVGRSAAIQFIRGVYIPDSSPVAIMGVFNNSQCVTTASLLKCYFSRKSTRDPNHNTTRRQVIQRLQGTVHYRRCNCT